MLVLCCVRELRALNRVAPTLGRFDHFFIDPDGHCHLKKSGDAGGTAYYSQIQFAGMAEPVSGKAGLALLPNTIVYSGLVHGFMESFSQYRESPGLHLFTAFFFEAGACLWCNGESMEVGGTGSITLLRENPFAANGKDFELQQFGPGEKFRMTSVGVRPQSG